MRGAIHRYRASPTRPAGGSPPVRQGGAKASPPSRSRSTGIFPRAARRDAVALPVPAALNAPSLWSGRASVPLRTSTRVGVPASAGSQRGPSGPGRVGWGRYTGLKPLGNFRLKAGLRRGCDDRSSRVGSTGPTSERGHLLPTNACSSFAPPSLADYARCMVASGHRLATGGAMQAHREVGKMTASHVPRLARMGASRACNGRWNA